MQEHMLRKISKRVYITPVLNYLHKGQVYNTIWRDFTTGKSTTKILSSLSTIRLRVELPRLHVTCIHSTGQPCRMTLHHVVPEVEPRAHFTTCATGELQFTTWDHFLSLILTCFNYKNKRHTCSSWASPVRLTNVFAIWEQQSFLKRDAATIYDLCVSSAHKLLLWNGPHLWWHYTNSKGVLAGVCGPGRFHQHPCLHAHHYSSLVFQYGSMVVELVSLARLYNKMRSLFRTISWWTNHSCSKV